MKIQSGPNIIIKKISDVIVLVLVDGVNDHFQSAKYPILRKKLCKKFVVCMPFH